MSKRVNEETIDFALALALVILAGVAWYRRAVVDIVNEAERIARDAS